MTDRPQCVAMTQKGTRCEHRAAPGSELCGNHLRRGLYSPERADRLILMLQAGNVAAVACRAAGLSERQFYVWIERGRRGEEPYREFADRVERARAEAEVRSVTQIANAATADWRAASYMLDKRLRDELPAPLDTTKLADRAADVAREEAVDALQALGEPIEISSGAVERYASAVALSASLEAQWEHLGRPGTAPGGATGTAPVPHPLISQISLARREAAQLGGLLGLDPLGRWKLARRVTGAGRPAGAASAADRADPGPPRRRLRAVD